MPTEAELKAVNKPKGKPTKGKPLGIPLWGWIAAAAVGLILGYMLLKRSSASAANSAPAPSSNPSDNGAGADSGGGGGIAIPPGTNPGSANTPTQDLISTLQDPGPSNSSSTSSNGSTSINPNDPGYPTPGGPQTPINPNQYSPFSAPTPAPINPNQYSPFSTPTPPPPVSSPSMTKGLVTS